MKAIMNANVEGKTLTVLVEKIDIGKAKVDYFINGGCVTGWEKLDELDKRQLAIMADVLCEQMD